MKALRAALLRVAGFLRLTRRNDEISDELRAHLEMLVDEYQRRGLSAAEARRAATAEFGSLTSAAEAYRDRRGLPALEDWIRDCRYGLRSLAHTRVLSASMIVVLALGIGVATMLGSLFHAIVFRPLPLTDPDRVVKLAQRLEGDVNRRVSGHVSQFSYPELTLYQSATRALAGVAGFRHDNATWLHDGVRVPLPVALVTGNYFDLLQVRPALGRLLAETDRQQPVAVISHRLWTSAFGRDPLLVGKAVVIDRVHYTVVGVAARSFAGTEIDTVDAWLPLDFAAPARGHAQRMTDASMSWLQIVGRLAPGATVRSAAAEATVIATRFDALHPGQQTIISVSNASALDAGVETEGEIIVVAVGAVVAALGGVVLLICASNAAALLLARGAARQRELALRMALGAGRWRVVQQLLTESALLALIAAALGVALSTIALRAAAHALPMSGYFEGFVPDAAVISLAILAALAAAMFFGVAPAIYATRFDPLPVLKQQTFSLSTAMPASRFRHTLVAAQVAVSLILLVSSALLGRAVERALRLDSGFSLSNLYAIDVDVPAGPSAATERATLNRQLALALQSRNDVGVGLTAATPFSSMGFTSARNAQMRDPMRVRFNKIDAGYFNILGVRNVAGRSFDARDAAASVVVNTRLARAFWGDERTAIGQTLTFPREERPRPAGDDGPEFQTATVVGVVPTLHSTEAGVPDGPTFYLPLVEDDVAHASFLVRSSARPAVQRVVDDVVRGRDVTTSIASIEQRVVSSTMPVRIAAATTVLVGLLTLIIAGVGIYGIVAHSVVSRTHEIGVHTALGAPRKRVLGLVLGSSLRAIVIGGVVGSLVMIVTAIAASRALAPLLFGMPMLDPLAVVGATLFLGLVTGLAAYVPARRALGLNPTEALRRI
jgi:predicted permease